ncbi:MAG: nuclear transport factor 2 family protein [Anaerolineae bacterium]|nr:nuclear transport factor 2 family protein [Anaerolineae bacterium]MCI0609352.1 nuclear transport factor 2 family protein [Anaerolineae bacterium]
MKADPTTYQAVKSVLDNWAESYRQRDIQRLLASVAPDPDVIMYGTGADEKRIGIAGIQAQAERDWSQTESAAFILNETSISSAGSVAWAAADAVFQLTAGGQEMALPARFTAVLEKREDNWLIVQAHFSLPAPDQDEGQSFPA